MATNIDVKPFAAAKPPSKIKITTVPAKGLPSGMYAHPQSKVQSIAPPIVVSPINATGNPAANPKSGISITAKPAPSHSPIKKPSAQQMGLGPVTAAPGPEAGSNKISNDLQESQRSPLKNGPGSDSTKNLAVIKMDGHETDVSREPVPAQKAEEESTIMESPCLRGFGIALSLLLFFASCGYMAMAGLCAYDKRGKEAYFAEDSEQTESQFPVAIAARITSISAGTPLTLKTDNWGYFYTAFKAVQDDSNSGFKDYNVFIPILVTAGVSGILSFIGGLVETRKFWKFQASLAVCGLVFTLLSLLCAIGGNGYVFYLIYKFDKDFKDLFTACDCSSFKDDLYRSITYYFIAVVAFLSLNLLQLIVSVVFCAKRKVLPVHPMTESGAVQLPQAPTQS